jgi:hypothetical protein
MPYDGRCSSGPDQFARFMRTAQASVGTQNCTIDGYSLTFHNKQGKLEPTTNSLYNLSH